MTITKPSKNTKFVLLDNDCPRLLNYLVMSRTEFTLDDMDLKNVVGLLEKAIEPLDGGIMADSMKSIYYKTVKFCQDTPEALLLTFRLSLVFLTLASDQIVYGLLLKTIIPTDTSVSQQPGWFFSIDKK